MRILPFIASFLLLGTFSTASYAAEKAPNRKSMEKTAKTACLMGDYQKGATLLVNLFVETNDPVYIFNQGRCFEQNHRWEEALDRFREYARKEPHLSANEKGDVEKHIAECEGHLSKMAPPTVLAPPPISTTSPSPAPQPKARKPVQAESEIKQASSTSPTNENTGSGLRIAGVVTGAVGVAAVAAGVYCNLRHESLISDLNKHSAEYSDQQFKSKQSEIDRYKTWGWIGFGVGATAMIAGTTLYILGTRSSENHGEQTKISLLPVINPNETSLVLSGAF